MVRVWVGLLTKVRVWVSSGLIVTVWLLLSGSIRNPGTLSNSVTITVPTTLEILICPAESVV